MAQGDKDKAAWSVLVYMAGDNNLTEDMAWGLQELKKKAGELEASKPLPKDRINVVAHFDPRSSRSRRYEFAPPSRINQPPPQASEDGNLHSYEAMIYTRGNNGAGNGQPGAAGQAYSGAGAGRTNPLRIFVGEQVAASHSADNHFLVLSGHGSGAVGDFLPDSDPPTSLSIPELAQILAAAREDARKEYELPPDFRIAILGMDSCLMSNAEVCFEIRDHAEYVVASEGWVANAGWPYHRVLEACLDGAVTDRGAEWVARRVAKLYSDFYRDYEISGISTDIAVCSLKALREGEASVHEGLQSFSHTCIQSFDAVFVRDALARQGIDKVVKGDVVPLLAAEIARLLKKPELQLSLKDGSKKAPAELHSIREFLTLSGTQRRAVREFVESYSGIYGLGDDGVAKSIAENWEKLEGEFRNPTSASMALGLVRLLREFDPGVLRALGEIEDQEREGKPEAKQARALLQKLHQVQWVLELDHFAKGIVKNVQGDVELLSAVVASRWRAQSFKGGVYVDLLDLCRCLGEAVGGERMKQVCDGVVSSFKPVVLESMHTGTASQHASGLSVYFPCQATDYSSKYDNLEFARKTGWGRLVRAYLRATRRERRDERANWADIEKQVVRFGQSEVDPLETDGIEARIVGVISPAPAGVGAARTDGKQGIEGKIRQGIEGKIKSGIEGKIKGEAERLVWGNPPDGFFRSVSLRNGAAASRIDDTSAPPPGQ